MNKVKSLLTFVKQTIFNDAVRKMKYNLSGFNKYGLHHDDCLDDMDPDVKEAIRRLPQKIIHERNYRILRATQLSMCHTVLPECEWTKYEEDCRYLQPYVEEVKRERLERKYWNKR